MPHSEQKQKPPSILKREADEPKEMAECASPKSLLGLNLAESPRSNSKSVSIANLPGVISPLLLGEQKGVDTECDLEQPLSPRRRPSVKGPGSKRLSGRLSVTSSPAFKPGKSFLANYDPSEDESSQGHRSNHHYLEHLVDQVSEWIKEERTKRAEKKGKPSQTDGNVESRDWGAGKDQEDQSLDRRGSDVSESSFDLNKLEDIIKYNLKLKQPSRQNRNRSPTSQSRRGSVAKLWRKQSSASSDNDHYESDSVVPSCNVVLDNSKTLQHAGGASSDSDSTSDDLERKASYKDQDEWALFKFEIVRLTHTLRLKGWRKVPMKMSNDINVERLSGALTNAVYVVSPPTDLPHHRDRGSASGSVQPKKAPPKLLLRIYGPQVEHLIDRDAELAILRRLAKKKIGPRLLGTFANGRFEEYFYANPLTPDDLRNPDTSRQIAKRMRELHDGVDLLDSEREAGAFVWRNWDSWVHRVEKVVSWLDSQITQLEPGARPTGTEAWKRRGHICLVPWKEFRQMVEKYRSWLNSQYGGVKNIREQLVFAHNDTQYGNILRFMPTGESPLLLPANTHKQLIVIDFEYANANVPGMEFANHFTEWCYNYHDPRKPYAFHSTWYPTPEEQDRLIRAYVRHRPQFNVSTPKLGPSRSPSVTSVDELLIRRPTSSISDFMLDARTPSSSSLNHQNEELARKANEDREVKQLMHETRIWRLANTAMWVAWGIVQAKVPGMPEFDGEQRAEPGSSSDEEAGREELGERADVYKDLALQQEQQQDGEGTVDGSEQEELDEEFDYLGYAQHRATFFWGDAVQMGFVKEEDLPQEAREKLKKVPY